MKQIITFLFALLLLISNGQVCAPYGNITNPSSASNPGAPNSHYINSFNWFQEAVNNVLFDIPLTNMTDYYSVSSVLNPYNDDNSLCYYLTEADLTELDVYPEDVWELLFFNLGHYPDLTLLSAESETSANADQKHIKL